VELDITWGKAIRIWWSLLWRNLLLAIVVSVFVGMPIGFIIGFSMSAMGAPQEMILFVCWPIGFFIGLASSVIPIKMILGKDFGDFRLIISSNTFSPDSTVGIANIEKCDLDERFYEQAAEEFDTNAVEQGLKLKAEIEAGGDNVRTRLVYIYARAKQIRQEELKRKKCEVQARWRPRIRFFFRQTLVTLFYLIGSTRLVDDWPGLVHVPFWQIMWAFIWPMFCLSIIGFILSIPIFLVLGFIKGLDQKLHPLTVIVIMSFILALLDVTKTVAWITGEAGWGAWCFLQ